MTAALRTIAEAEAAGQALWAAQAAAGAPPLTQAQADRAAAVLAPHWPAILAARQAQAA